MLADIDCVVMLTWSDWKAEPRSNRYHYATRFARHWPVYFVQPDGTGEDVTFEKVDGHDITLVHVAADYGTGQAERLTRALRGRGVTRPLVWVYNAFFTPAFAPLSPALVVYHATEDYVAPVEGMRITSDDISHVVRGAVAKADLLVAVSPGVADSYVRHGGFQNPVLMLPNGCDHGFWEATGAAAYRAPANGARVALFQGGINHRLDYPLLLDLARRLPEWQFWFCGREDQDCAGWAELRQEPNVRAFGLLAPEGIAELARQSRVGLIPFVQDALMRRSLPLKAYEYVACGLPVASIPIDALAGPEDLFTFGTNAAEFAAALPRLDPTRDAPEALARRRAAAAAASYDARFAELLDALEERLRLRRKARPALNVLVLYDDNSTHVGTILEHLDAFRRYSEHRFHFLPATGSFQATDPTPRLLDFSPYDAVVVHYSVRVSLETHLAPEMASAMEAYRGPKLLFIQDEYDRTETARCWIERLGIDAVFTNVPEDGLETVYPRARFPRVDFIPTLTGYVPENPYLDEFAQPMAARGTLIAYRGRTLPHKYGALGQEKLQIGLEVRRLAAARGLPVDIAVDEESRIYGDDWYRFLGSARATLGTESGSNVFDFDGELARLSVEHADMPFEDFAARFLGPHEGLVRMNQVSPKIFEAIRLRTALVLFEGGYSGVMRPWEHYIPLHKDYANFDEVVARLQDLPFLEELTARAYRDVIASGRYAYRSFVAEVDGYLGRRALGRRRASIVSVPLAAVYEGGLAVPLASGHPSEALRSDAVLGRHFPREEMVALAARIAPPPGPAEAPAAPPPAAPLPAPPDGLVGVARALWRLLPAGLRRRIGPPLGRTVRRFRQPAREALRPGRG